MSSYPPAHAHGPLTQVFPDIWVVRGSIKMGILGWMSRNMTVVRDGGKLTVFHPVRLGEETQADLDALGKVENVVSLGFFHGYDDAWYVDHYKAKVWAPPGKEHKGGIHTDVELVEGGPTPVKGATILSFKNARKPEVVMVLERHGGVLLSCDACQNFIDLTGCSPQMKLFLTLMGFKKPASLGPGWLRFVEDKNGPDLSSDFQRLLELPFRHLLSAHGVPLKETAHEGLEASIRARYTF